MLVFNTTNIVNLDTNYTRKTDHPKPITQS
jgi:hypothetical protein